MRIFTTILKSILLFTLIVPVTVSAKEMIPTKINIISFNGGWNLPIWVAEREGFFKNHGIDVNLEYTKGSKQLIQDLNDGKYQIAIAGLDNVIAYQEGQGTFKIKNPDMFAFMGVDNGLLSIVSRPEIKTINDLKSKKLSVDSLSTGYAFVLKDFINNNNIKDINYTSIGSTNLRYEALLKDETDATLLRTPMDIMAKNKGMNILASGKQLGNFQGTVGVTTHKWAQANSIALVSFISAYREALDWLFNNENQEIAVAMLVANSKDMTPEIAKLALNELITDGLQHDAKIDADGVKNVMKLRSKYAEPSIKLVDHKKYYDESYYNQSVK